MSRRYRQLKRDGRHPLEHRLVMAEVLGRPLRADELVHHIDHNKLNNDPANLVVMTASEHSRHHNDKHPRSKRCEVCGVEYEPAPTKRARSKTCGARECWRTLAERNRQATLARKGRVTPPVMDAILQRCIDSLKPASEVGA